MLQLSNYIPMPIERIKIRWDEIMNIPNDEWNRLDVERSINLINNRNAPHTLRTVTLNMLPVLVIRIMDEI
jgi:hypothetical protein